ncbi:MAG: hypothetical protein WD872_19100 [Pirellulaceae bacterium]
MSRCWHEEDGVLSFEWTLLATLVVVGIVGGVAGARDAIIDELGDVAQGMLALDQSYSLSFPLQIEVHVPTASSASDSGFIDAQNFRDCDTTFPGPPDQQMIPGLPIFDADDGG